MPFMLSNSRMRLLVLSDLHLEQWRDHGPPIDLSVSKPDVVILTGDIATGTRGVEWAAQRFAGLPVLYVSGNHEAYGAAIEDMEANLEMACAATDNVLLLNAREFHHTGVRFLGTTLWTDFDLFGKHLHFPCKRAVEKGLADYRLIRLARDGGRALRANDTLSFHREQKSWLVARLGEPHGGPTVVVTHMAPSMKSIATQFKNILESAAFASNLDDLAAKVTVWVHGHTHDSFDYQIGACRVVCNPRGYRLANGTPENPAFNPNLIVTL